MLQLSKNDTINEIVNIVAEMPKKFQSELLKQLKLKKALKLSRKIDSLKTQGTQFTDQEIADMVHNFRTAKK